jgi:hypothetical protein
MDQQALRALLKTILTQHSVDDFNSALRYLYETDGDYRTRVIADHSGVMPPLPGYETSREAEVTAALASKGYYVNFVVTLRASSVDSIDAELRSLRKLREKLEHLEGLEDEAEALQGSIDNIEMICEENR